MFAKRAGAAIPGEWYEHTAEGFFLQMLAHASPNKKQAGIEYLEKHPPKFEWIVDQFAKYTEVRSEQEVLYLDVDDSIRMQILRPAVTRLLEQLIAQESKKKENAKETGTATATSRSLCKLRSFLQKPVTPYQEVLTLVLIHAFHPELVYRSF